ncbi:unnamed protein product [Vitrella brassicaformis CCMP3155]|uniref:Hydroxylysine kinase n=1 Tax=Vitrella brassicaformis (strain CCMP3155) TaxID=1169540 RepID=A0A0G4G3C0_VITBC|nr:unnamed protein product [Vitrella brassicaformis CCMP3155]|eukprot:CEM22762.1 unnamed protein product [Vitrella brassicaformis CCMP3155]
MENRPRGLDDARIFALLKDLWGIYEGSLIFDLPTPVRVPSGEGAGGSDAACGVVSSIELRGLESYDDFNAHVVVRVGDEARMEYVFKATMLHTRQRLELQTEVMTLLNAAGLPCPAVVPSVHGRHIERADGLTTDGTAAADECNGKKHRPTLVRLLTYLPGKVLPLQHHRSRTMLINLGRLAGRVSAALEGYEHPASEWDWEWNIATLIATCRPRVRYEQQAHRRELATLILDEFERVVCPRLSSLRQSVAHTDLNDTNLLWAGDECCGVLDFGDVIHTATCFEVGICAGYHCIAQPDPWEAALTIIQSYDEGYPLTDDEIEVLPLVVQARILMSALNSIYYQTLEPDNEYLSHTHEPGWRTLEQLGARLEIRARGQEVAVDELKRRLKASRGGLTYIGLVLRLAGTTE